MLSCLWGWKFKRTLAANRKEYPMWRQQVCYLAECSFTICPTPYSSKQNVLSASLNKTFPSFLSTKQHIVGSKITMQPTFDAVFHKILKEGRKEMFYLTTHSTHFYLRLYGVRHMVKDHSDSEKGNPLPPHRLLFPISSKGSFICTIPQTG